MNKSILKLKKMINHSQIHHPIVDEEVNYFSLKDEQKEVNENLNKELLAKNFEMKVTVSLVDIVGDYLDEVSLLNQVSGQFFQCIPNYHC